MAKTVFLVSSSIVLLVSLAVTVMGGCAPLKSKTVKMNCTHKIEKITQGIDCSKSVPSGTRAFFSCPNNTFNADKYDMITCGSPTKKKWSGKMIKCRSTAVTATTVLTTSSPNDTTVSLDSTEGESTTVSVEETTGTVSESSSITSPETSATTSSSTTYQTYNPTTVQPATTSTALMTTTTTTSTTVAPVTMTVPAPVYVVNTTSMVVNTTVVVVHPTAVVANGTVVVANVTAVVVNATAVVVNATAVLVKTTTTANATTAASTETTTTTLATTMPTTTVATTMPTTTLAATTTTIATTTTTMATTTTTAAPALDVNAVGYVTYPNIGTVKISKVPLTFNSAWDDCALGNALLFIPNSVQKVETMATLFNNSALFVGATNDSNVWIGFTTPNRVWITVRGDPVTSMPNMAWGASSITNGNCATLRKGFTGFFQTKACYPADTVKYPYICEK